jgi:hypothetical protein
VVGGGGLIQTPALFLFLPTVPVPTVLGTGKVASLVGTAAAAASYLGGCGSTGGWPDPRRPPPSSAPISARAWRAT